MTDVTRFSGRGAGKKSCESARRRVGSGHIRRPMTLAMACVPNTTFVLSSPLGEECLSRRTPHTIDSGYETGRTSLPFFAFKEVL